MDIYIIYEIYLLESQIDMIYDFPGGADFGATPQFVIVMKETTLTLLPLWERVQWKGALSD